jgi:hypothetical protein
MASKTCFEPVEYHTSLVSQWYLQCYVPNEIIKTSNELPVSSEVSFNLLTPNRFFSVNLENSDLRIIGLSETSQVSKGV